MGYISLLTALLSGLACSKDNPTGPIIPDDTTPPVISNFQQQVNSYNAKFTWVTDEDARYDVDYKSDSIPEITKTTYSTNHSATLPDLEPGKSYTVEITVYDRNDNKRTRTENITTLPPPDTTAPTISNLTLETSNEGDENPFIKFTYTTNEPTADSIYVENAGKIYPLGETTSKTAHSFMFSDPAADSANITLVAIDEAGNSSRRDTSAVVDAAERYGLIVTTGDSPDWAVEDEKAFKDFLEERGHNVTYLKGETETTPTKAEITYAISQIKEKTDPNDEVVFVLGAHSSPDKSGEISIGGEWIGPEEIVNQWNEDDYGIIKYFATSCTSKLVIDRTSMPRSINMGPAWDKFPAMPFFNKTYGTIAGIIPEFNNKPDITIGELFTELYNDYWTTLQKYHPFLGIKDNPAEPPGEYQAYSDKDGNIHGYSEWLDRRAFRIPELREK